MKTNKKISRVLLGIGFVLTVGSFSAQATKWVGTGDTYLGSDGNIYEVMRCERKFLSFDGCDVGEYGSECITCPQ